MAILAFAVNVPVAFGGGIGEGGIVNRDGAIIYKSSNGPTAEIADLPRGFAVGGITSTFSTTIYQFEEEEGRVHVTYMTMNDNGEQKSLAKVGWINRADLDQFTYECGCETGNQTKCSPKVRSGFASFTWNACFKEGMSKKSAELKTKWDKETGLSIPPSSQTSAAGGSNVAASSEKPLVNDDIVALAKAGFGDELIVSKIQQTPRESLDVSVDTLIRLKTEGVSKNILDAMVKRAGQRK